MKTYLFESIHSLQFAVPVKTKAQPRSKMLISLTMHPLAH